MKLYSIGCNKNKNKNNSEETNVAVEFITDLGVNKSTEILINSGLSWNTTANSSYIVCVCACVCTIFGSIPQSHT